MADPTQNCRATLASTPVHARARTHSEENRMFAFPTWQDALGVREACAHGDLDEARRLHKQRFDAGAWGYPGEDSDHYAAFVAEEEDVLESIRDEWKPGWLTSAARGGHTHTLQWLISLDIEGHIDDHHYFKFIANGYIERLRLPGGSVEDALGACGEGWWPYDDDEHPYNERTCWIETWEVDPATATTFSTGKTIFSRRTPEFVREAFDQPDIVSHVVRVAYDCYGVADDENGARLVGIADDLMELGFEFCENVCLLMDYHVEDHADMRRLMHKMIRIHGGRAHVRLLLPRYDNIRRAALAKVALLRCVVRLLVASARAKKRAWHPDSAHFTALKANFTRCANTPPR